MNKLSFILLILILFTLSSSIIYCAPGMDTLALNQETKECGIYSSGDEFTRYKLPDGWINFRINYIELDNTFIVETPAGNCIYTNRGAEACCAQLNYTYVDHIGKRTEIIAGILLMVRNNPPTLIPLLGLVLFIALFLFLVINTIRRKLKQKF